MNMETSLGTKESLIERAAEMYNFRLNIRHVRPLEREQESSSPSMDDEVEPPAEELFAPEPVQPAPRKQPVILAAPVVTFEEASPAAPPLDLDEPSAVFPEAEAPGAPEAPRRVSKVDRANLREGGFILSDAPVGSLAEEFRIVKRQLLQAASGATGIPADKRQTILVCSPTADEGKTFCAVNLAISMANEKDLEVLLVDGDFSKPEILSVLGLEGGPGLIDAIADPDADPNDYIIQTDIKRLSVLPAGRQANNVTELLASRRTRQVLDALTAHHPKRIVIFDSPPALMASPASILAGKVGQIVMVVRADKTTEADLRDAVGLLSGCDNISLMLNGTGFTASPRRFGSYYGIGQ